MEHAQRLGRGRSIKPPGPPFWRALAWVVMELIVLVWLSSSLAVDRGSWRLIDMFFLGVSVAALRHDLPVLVREWRAWRDGL